METPLFDAMSIPVLLVFLGVVVAGVTMLEYGIHVHIHDGVERIVDDTFGEVILNGKPMPRCELSIGCPSGPGRGSWSCRLQTLPRRRTE